MRQGAGQRFSRWLAAVGLFLLWLPAFPARSAAPGETGGPPAPVSAVGAIGLTVSDVERSARFFGDVLGFRRVSETEVTGPEYDRLQGVFGLRMRVVRMRLGEETLELSEYLAPRGRPMPADSRGNDAWFQHVAIVVRDLERAYASLRGHRVEHASAGPQRLPDWNPSAGGIEAFYFRDPDGHFLELIEFPPDRGDPRWHRSGAGLFLGIDHTAIVVRDTETSLSFYRDVLGLAVAGTSENWGAEQERLNGVFGARLRITTLRAPAGPGIELLEYRTPRDGRPRPGDARANDLLHWQTDLAAPGPLADLAAQLFARRVPFVSPGATELPDDALGFRVGMLVSDPDGHVLRVREPVPPARMDRGGSP